MPGIDFRAQKEQKERHFAGITYVSAATESRGETRARLTFIYGRLNDLTDAQIDTLVYPHRAVEITDLFAMAQAEGKPPSNRR